jgi:hypothetical protein
MTKARNFTNKVFEMSSDPSLRLMPFSPASFIRMCDWDEDRVAGMMWGAEPGAHM